MLDRLIDATYTRDRGRHLDAANLGIEKLRFLRRLAKGPAAPRHAALTRTRARVLDETGRLIGGWRKAHHAARS